MSELKGHGIEVCNQDAHKALHILSNMTLVDEYLKILRRNKTLVIPIKHSPSESELSEIVKHFPSANFVEADFMQSHKKPRNMRDATEGYLPPHIVDKLPRSYDIVGDIAVVELDKALESYSRFVGEGIMKLNPNLRLVVKKSSITCGQYRTRRVETIAGIGGTETIHREFSSKFRLDVASVYFNPRLSHERMRVAEQVGEGEVVVDMFAGVGPYSILIAKMHENVKVFSLDLNPVAFKYLKENAFVNKVADRVIPLMGNVREYASRLRGVADRVVMNLPSDSSAFLDVAANILKESGGTVHYYCFAARNEKIQSITSACRSILESHGKKVAEFTFGRAIKEVAANRVEVCLDIIVT